MCVKYARSTKNEDASVIKPFEKSFSMQQRSWKLVNQKNRLPVIVQRNQWFVLYNALPRQEAAEIKYKQLPFSIISLITAFSGS